MRRFTRLTKAFSKKFGISDHPLSLEDIVGIVDEWEAARKDQVS